ncbi:MAG: hypothetical protein ABIQ90_08730 [Polaromonas sp.]
MNLPSNTPPDGDFARYLERLTGSQAVAGASADLLTPKTGASADMRFVASSGVPSSNAGLQPLTGMSFWTHVKWVFVLWTVAQVLAMFVPSTGFVLFLC